MTISELQGTLKELNEITFLQPDGSYVPRHFHLTEIGLTIKQFIDCGGVIHTQKKANLQLWVSTDYEHRLPPSKLSNIVSTSLPLFDGEDLEIEVEYQKDTVGKYGLSFNGSSFQLRNTQTDCLAADQCGTPDVMNKTKQSLAALGKALTPSSELSCCTPSAEEGGCC